jgi:hypothetical protein
VPNLPIVHLRSDRTDKVLPFLIDTGSAVSLISEKVLRPGTPMEVQGHQLKAFTGDIIDTTGACSMRVATENKSFEPSPFVVTRQAMTQFLGIIGNDWLD